MISKLFSLLTLAVFASAVEDAGFLAGLKQGVFMIDEASMIDDRTWLWLRDQLSSVGAAPPRTDADKHPDDDDVGRVNSMVYGLEAAAPGHLEPSFRSWGPRVPTCFPIPGVAPEQTVGCRLERGRTTNARHIPRRVGRCRVLQGNTTRSRSARGCLR